MPNKLDEGNGIIRPYMIQRMTQVTGYLRCSVLIVYYVMKNVIKRPSHPLRTELSFFKPTSPPNSPASVPSTESVEAERARGEENAFAGETNSRRSLFTGVADKCVHDAKIPEQQSVLHVPVSQIR